MTVPPSIRLYTDEDVHTRLAPELVRGGFDALSCRDARNAGRSLSDDWQLRFATDQGRVMLTHDMGDYLRLVRVWERRGDEHTGIILAHRAPLGELLIRVERHLLTYSAEDHHNLVLHLAKIDDEEAAIP